MSKPIGIVGTGAWGTALAQTLALSGNDVLMWSFEKELARTINTTHQNPTFLPGTALSERIRATATLEKLPDACDVIFSVCPAANNSQIAATLSQSITNKHTVVIGSKGFRESDGALLTDVWQETIPTLTNIAVLSGPSFAAEVAARKPSALVLAASKKPVLKQIGALFNVPFMRLYFSNDVTGVQIGGALKNVLAIAAGIADTLDLGYNARAAIICRGIAEMCRYGEALGAHVETMYGLSGLGNVLLIDGTKLSKNYRLGVQLAKGASVHEALHYEKGVIEGVHTAHIIAQQARSKGLELGVIGTVDAILKNELAPHDAITHLFSRSRTWETIRDDT